MMQVLLAVVIGAQPAWACISKQTREVSFQLVEKNPDGAYIIEVKAQDFDNQTKKPVSGEARFKFVEDDFAAIVRILDAEAFRSPEKAATLKEPAVAAIQGHIAYLKRNQTLVLLGMKEKLRGSWEMKNNPSVAYEKLGKIEQTFTEKIAELEAALQLAKNNDVKGGLERTRWAMADIGLIHTYDRQGGGPKVTLEELFPPVTRSACSSSSHSIKGQELLTAKVPVAPPHAARDPLLGLGTATGASTR